MRRAGNRQNRSMCLFVTVRVQGADAEALEKAAVATSSEGAPMQMGVFKPRRKEPELTISAGDGWHGSGCACSLLAETADWNAPTWDMEPRARRDLAQTIDVLARHLPRPFSIEALWDGDPVEREHRVTVVDVVDLANADALGTRDRYIVST